MKKLFSFMVVICIVLFCSTAFGQDAAKSKNDKKGGFSVGGYDQTRKSTGTTRGVVINKEVEKADKAVEAEKSNEDGAKAEAPAPAPAMEAKEVPAAAPPKEKAKPGNANNHNKSGTTGKQKQKSDPKPAGKQK
jgi:hypothetical protein